MSRRSHRQVFRTRIEPGPFEVGEDRREANVEMIEEGGVEPHVVDVLFEHSGGDRARHDIAWQEFVDEALTAGVPEHRAVSAERLRQQRTRHRRVIEGGGMELEELEVGHCDLRPERHRHAVAGGDGRVGRHPEQLTGTAGGQQGVPGQHLERSTVGPHGAHPDAPTGIDDEVEGEGLFVDLAYPLTDRGDERPLDLRSGRRPARVDDARHRMPAFAGQFELAVGVAIETRPQSDQVHHPGGAFVDEQFHRFDVAQPHARRQGVGKMEIGLLGISRDGGRNTSLRPTRGRLTDLALGHDPDRQRQFLRGTHRGRQAGHSAAEHQEVERDHDGSLSSPTAMLSIRRVEPNRTAPRSRLVGDATSTSSRVSGSATVT